MKKRFLLFALFASYSSPRSMGAGGVALALVFGGPLEGAALEPTQAVHALGVDFLQDGVDRFFFVSDGGLLARDPPLPRAAHVAVKHGPGEVGREESERQAAEMSSVGGIPVAH